jgi:hypothetical protein
MRNRELQTDGGSPAGWWRGLLVGLLFFVGIAPTLTWLEFSNGIENLNVETALEMRRGGSWMVPTLMGEPRVRKPPLNAWITAAAVNPRTVEDMSSHDASVRERAWKDLSWQTRWPALLASCLTLVFAYHLGAMLLGPRAGMYGAIIAGTTLLFLKYSRSATTDVHLVLWVTAANVCIAKLIFERRVWLGLAGAGIALGMAMMSKGPVSRRQSRSSSGVRSSAQGTAGLSAAAPISSPTGKPNAPLCSAPWAPRLWGSCSCSSLASAGLHTPCCNIAPQPASGGWKYCARIPPKLPPRDGMTTSSSSPRCSPGRRCSSSACPSLRCPRGAR